MRLLFAFWKHWLRAALLFSHVDSQTHVQKLPSTSTQFATVQLHSSGLRLLFKGFSAVAIKEGRAQLSDLLWWFWNQISTSWSKARPFLGHGYFKSYLFAICTWSILHCYQQLEEIRGKHTMDVMLACLRLARYSLVYCFPSERSNF